MQRDGDRNDDASLEQRAIASTVGLACELGLQLSEGRAPVVLADRSNLVLHLVPHSLVARVAMATSLTRIGASWLARRVDRTFARSSWSDCHPACAIDRTGAS